jgi:hypothetical protein
MEEQMVYQPKLLVDFDGVIHRYSRGWADGSIYDEPMEGAKEALNTLEVCGFEVVIFSTRDGKQIWDWLFRHGFPKYRVTNIKEPSVALIDDRAIRFRHWDHAMEQVFELSPIEDWT